MATISFVDDLSVEVKKPKAEKPAAAPKKATVTKPAAKKPAARAKKQEVKA
jgi:hypothetical protein